MLVALYKGMSPTFTVDRWMNSEDQLRVALSAANFKAAYNDYIKCVAGLLPANYRQVARTAVLFSASGLDFVGCNSGALRVDCFLCARG